MFFVGVEMTYFWNVIYIIKFYNMLNQATNDVLYHRILT